MAATPESLFGTVPASDPLNFWHQGKLDYRHVTDFLEFDTNELSKLGGVSKRSVRLDERIPHDLKKRIEQIAIICTLVAEYFNGNPQKTELWFRTLNPLLGNVAPRDMIRFGRYKKLLNFIQEARGERNKETRGAQA